MNGNNKIPEHWQLRKLGDVGHIIMGQSPPSNTYNSKGEGLAFFQGKAEFTDLYPVVEKWCSLPNKIAEPNDILLSVRAPVGTTNIANQKCCIGRGLAAIRYDNYKYLFYFLRSIEKELDRKGTGTTFKAISGEVIRNIKMPIAPLDEQHTIVAKIEELFSELDNGKQQLEIAQQQLKVYRQSLLKAAFEGRLTRLNHDSVDFHDNQDLKNGKNQGSDNGELPKGWKWVKVGDVCKCIVPNRDKPKSFSGNIKWVTTPNLKPHSIKLNYSEIQSGLSDSEIKEYNARVIPIGGVIMTCVGTFGLSAIVEKPIVINQQLHAFLSNDVVDAKYLAYCIQHNKHFFELKSTSTTIKYLNKENCNSMPLPLPSLKEQQEIVQELESKLTVCDKIEDTISQSLQQAETLRQGILKKAFEGRLVNSEKFIRKFETV